MHIILRFQDGEMIEALLLAVSRSRMRVVIPGCDDTMEFRLKNHRWTLTDERVAEVESMISDGKTIPVLFDAHVRHAA